MASNPNNLFSKQIINEQNQGEKKATPKVEKVVLSVSEEKLKRNLRAKRQMNPI